MQSELWEKFEECQDLYDEHKHIVARISLGTYRGGNNKKYWAYLEMYAIPQGGNTPDRPDSFRVQRRGYREPQEEIEPSSSTPLGSLVIKHPRQGC